MHTHNTASFVSVVIHGWWSRLFTTMTRHHIIKSPKCLNMSRHCSNRVLWNRKPSRFQLCHNHCPEIVRFPRIQYCVQFQEVTLTNSTWIPSTATRVASRPASARRPTRADNIPDTTSTASRGTAAATPSRPVWSARVRTPPGHDIPVT